MKATVFGEGSDHIQMLVNMAAKTPEKELELTGFSSVEKAIILPSDFTLVLSSCVLQLASGVFDNLFRSIGTHHVQIIGKGHAILDGGEYNGLSERTSGQNGFPHISSNNTVFFADVHHFRIHGISVLRQRWWGLCFTACSFGEISDVDFEADDRHRTPDGSLIHGFCVSNPGNIYIRNADGIDLRSGCHDINVFNITGFCEDDVVACTGIDWEIEKKYVPRGRDTSIYNIQICGVHACSLCGIVRLLNQGGVRMKNITVSDIYDTSADSPSIDRTDYAVRIGDPYNYGSREQESGETSCITISNIYSRARIAMKVWGEITDFHFSNFHIFDNGGQGEINGTPIDL